MSYIPRLGSAAQRAISYLGRVKGEVSTADLADAIACTPYGLGRTLGRAVDAGLLIKRQHKDGASAPLFWSVPAESVAEAVAPKPEPATDIPVVQRTVPAAEAGPSGWTPHPLDAAWHPRANGHAQNTPQEGANRDASAEQSHGAGGSDSPAGRGTNGAPVVSAAPAFIESALRGNAATNPANGGHREALNAPPREAPAEAAQVGGQELRDGHAEGRPDPVGAGQPADAGPADESLVGKTATISMTGEIAVVSECGTVILFAAQRAQQLREFFAGRVG